MNNDYSLDGVSDYIEVGLIRLRWIMRGLDAWDLHVGTPFGFEKTEIFITQDILTKRYQLTVNDLSIYESDNCDSLKRKGFYKVLENHFELILQILLNCPEKNLLSRRTDSILARIEIYNENFEPSEEEEDYNPMKCPTCGDTTTYCGCGDVPF